MREAAREAAKAAAMEVVARAVAVRAAPKAAVAQVMAMAAAVRVEVAWAAARAAAECFPTIAGRRGGGRGCEKGGSSLSYAKPSTSFRHDRQRQAGQRKSSSFLTSAIPKHISLHADQFSCGSQARLDTSARVETASLRFIFT
jgi:uncharacterized membrane protein YdfJ with MMPL/SSD domain